MRYTFLSMALVAIFGATVLGQDDRPLIDIVGGPTAAEDVPPPAPVPDNTSNPQPVADATGGEQHAYDFGVSYQPTNDGLKVSGVIVGSRASAAGVMPGDVIVSVDDGSPTSQSLQQDQVQQVTVSRNGAIKTLTIGAATNGGSAPMFVSNSGPTTATYVPESNAAYTVPRTTAYSVPQATAYAEPARTATYVAPRTAVYAVPRTTTYSAPRSYRYAPSYNYRYAPSYRSAVPYSTRAYSYSRRPAVSIGFGVGGGRGGFGPGLGYGGFGPGGFGPSIGRRGFSPYSGFGGRGAGFGRSGFGISIGF